MNEPHVLIWLLMELDGGVLMARRKAEAKPLAGQWTLPGDTMHADESSAETIWRVGGEMLDIQVIHETFVDTLYIKENGLEYAINVFSLAFEGQPRYRESGPFAEVRWCLPAELPKPLPEGLTVLLQQDGGRPPKEARSQGGASAGQA